MDPRGSHQAAWLVVLLLWATTLLLIVVGIASENPEVFLGTALGAMATGSIAVIAGRILRGQSEVQRQRLSPPAVRSVRPRRHRMPSPQSAASAPIQGLAGAEAALANLLGQLRDDNADPGWVAYAWQVANTAAEKIRTMAGKLEAVESAIAHTPPSQRPTLHDGVTRLRKWLDEGLEAYQGLVAAASRVVLASTPASVANELTEAADHLASVAQALTELSAQYPWLQAR